MSGARFCARSSAPQPWHGSMRATAAVLETDSSSFTVTTRQARATSLWPSPVFHGGDYYDARYHRADQLQKIRTWNLMMLCSLMRMARLVTLQSVLSGRAFFGACVCCRVSKHESRSNVCSDMS